MNGDTNGVRMSVALVTRNRPDSLERTLRSLRKQDTQPWEVVVSDDSDPQYAPTIRDLSRKYDCRYTQGPQRGLYANRNHAALACNGTHMRTMDDDHEFPPGHFAACRNALERDPTSVWTIAEKRPQTNTLHRPGQLNLRGYPVTPSDDQDSRAIADGSTIYPRRLFEDGIFFVEDFRMGPVYLEYGSRIHRLGARIRELRETHVFHHLEDREITDTERHLAARFFTMMTHALVHNQSWRAVAMMAFKMAQQVVEKRSRALRAIRGACASLRSNWELIARKEPIEWNTLL